MSSIIWTTCAHIPVSMPCAPCYFGADSTLLTYPTMVQSTTIELIPLATIMPNGSTVTTGTLTQIDGVPVTANVSSAGAYNNTVTAAHQLTWSWNGVIMTYPTSYLAYTAFSGAPQQPAAPTVTNIPTTMQNSPTTTQRTAQNTTYDIPTITFPTTTCTYSTNRIFLPSDYNIRSLVAPVPTSYLNGSLPGTILPPVLSYLDTLPDFEPPYLSSASLETCTTYRSMSDAEIFQTMCLDGVVFSQYVCANRTQSTMPASTAITPSSCSYVYTTTTITHYQSVGAETTTPSVSYQTALYLTTTTGSARIEGTANSLLAATASASPGSVAAASNPDITSPSTTQITKPSTSGFSAPRDSGTSSNADETVKTVESSVGGVKGTNSLPTQVNNTPVPGTPTAANDVTNPGTRTSNGPSSVDVESTAVQKTSAAPAAAISTLGQNGASTIVAAQQSSPAIANTATSNSKAITQIAASIQPNQSGVNVIPAAISTPDGSNHGAISSSGQAAASENADLTTHGANAPKSSEGASAATVATSQGALVAALSHVQSLLATQGGLLSAIGIVQSSAQGAVPGASSTTPITLAGTTINNSAQGTVKASGQAPQTTVTSSTTQTPNVESQKGASSAAADVHGSQTTQAGLASRSRSAVNSMTSQGSLPPVLGASSAGIGGFVFGGLQGGVSSQASTTTQTPGVSQSSTGAAQYTGSAEQIRTNIVLAVLPFSLLLAIAII